MLCRSKRNLPGRRGTSVVELAVLLPLLALLFVVAVDYARVFYYSVTLNECARNGALYARDAVAAKESPYTSVEEAALSNASNLDPAPTVTKTNGTDAKGQPYVQVTVTYTFNTLTSYPGVPGSVALSRTVRMHTAPAVPTF
jgi:Flp pilus assembly protein TadG